MKVIAITNNKGGVGKTTTAFHLAGAYAEDTAHRVLLIDLDQTQNLTSLFVPKDTRPSLFDVLVEEVPLAEAVHATPFDGISIVPSSDRLGNLDAYLSSKPDAQTRLVEALREFKPAQPFHVAILDCPPSLGIMTRNALAAARRVVIPIEAAKFSAQGLDQLLEVIESMRRAVNPELDVAGVLLSRFNNRRSTQQTYDAALRERQLPLLRTKIKDSAAYAKAIEVGRPITDYLSRSEFANAFRDLVEELDHAYAHN